jgi:thiamine biosynthesis lipoprotein
VRSASFRALGTGAVVCVTDGAALEGALVEVGREVDAIDRACSRFRADSELARVNGEAGRVTPVSSLLAEALAVALDAAVATEGLVDPTVGRTLRLAGYDRTFALVRVRDARAFESRFAEVPGWSLVALDAERGTVRIPRGTELDLGATAKALAADRAADAAANATGCGVLVSLGGDVAAAGAAPPGGWPIRIADDSGAPLDGQGPVVAIAGGGLATSSTEVRRWRAGGCELHHLVDPRTSRPAAGPWRTVTVAGASCVDANVAATAAIVLGEDAPDWLAERGLPARLVRASGSVVGIAGWPAERPLAA